MSPRHKKPRRCCCLCGSLREYVFKPAGIPSVDLEQVLLLRDEVEALRLCDLEGLTQHEAGVKMGVSRGTVQRLLAGARRKAADALVNRKAIIVGGEEGMPGQERLQKTQTSQSTISIVTCRTHRT